MGRGGNGVMGRGGNGALSRGVNGAMGRAVNGGGEAGKRSSEGVELLGKIVDGTGEGRGGVGGGRVRAGEKIQVGGVSYLRSKGGWREL
jgi:hypothetical protein